jgi:hypothetical protein
MAAKVLECALELRRGSCSVPPGRVIRVARLLALALKFERLIGQGAIADYACLARLGQVSRARITQIMNLVYLAPDIQEEILFAPRIVRGRDAIHLGQLQPIALVLNWQRQRLLWRKLLGRSGQARPF